MEKSADLTAPTVGVETWIDRILVGVLRGFAPSGEPLIDYPGNEAGAAIVGRTTVPLCRAHVNHSIVLTFENANSRLPIVLGAIQAPKAGKPCGGCGGESRQTMAIVDGDQLVLEAQREVVLRCGEASITLTRAGKVILRGNYVLSRSTGVNKIKGGSVQIN